MDNITYQTLITGAVLILSNCITYFGTRKKNNNDAFKNLVDANEQFRNEIRNDLIAAKKESQSYKDLVNELKEKINEYESQILDLKKEILAYRETKIEYEKEIQELRDKLNDERK
jgi:septal ring factor EnvC (AmiA/AmiB activator)